MNGYDFDGVITNGMHPSKDDVIVTGRSLDRHDASAQYLKDNDIKYLHLYMCPVLEEDVISSAEWKRFIINYLNLEKFYEDDGRIYNYLSKYCHTTDIIWVRDE